MTSSLRKLSRRDFLKLAAVGGAVLAVPALHFALPREEPELAYQGSFSAMGTFITIRIEDSVAQTPAELAAANAMNEARRLATMLTRFPDGTQILGLNQTGNLEAPSADVVDLLKRAIIVSDASGGSFDITLEPVLDLLQDYLSGRPFPSDAQFDAAKSLIGYEDLSVTDHFVSLTKPGMSVTLDGIATGYILDHMVASLKSSGVRSALVNIGGTVAAIGYRGDGSPWEAGIMNPTNPNSTLGTLHLKDQSVATSGDYENYYTADRRYFHIIDPATARSPLFSHSATVVTATGLQADWMGVTLMVDEPSRGQALADSQRCDYLLYTDGNRIITSAGMEGLLS